MKSYEKKILPWATPAHLNKIKRRIWVRECNSLCKFKMPRQQKRKKVKHEIDSDTFIFTLAICHWLTNFIPPSHLFQYILVFYCNCCKILEDIEIKENTGIKWDNPFHATGLFLYPQITPGSLETDQWHEMG